MKVLAKGTMLPEYTVVNSEGKEHKNILCGSGP